MPAFQSQEQSKKPRFHLISPVAELSIHWVHDKQHFEKETGSVKHQRKLT